MTALYVPPRAIWFMQKISHIYYTYFGGNICEKQLKIIKNVS